VLLLLAMSVCLHGCRNTVFAQLLVLPQTAVLPLFTVRESMLSLPSCRDEQRATLTLML
jgi:hypothetical protein